MVAQIKKRNGFWVIYRPFLWWLELWADDEPCDDGVVIREAHKFIKKQDARNFCRRNKVKL